MEAVLADIPPADRLPFLAYLEQEAKREGDLEGLRAIRDWRAQNPASPSTEPPKSA